MTSIQPTLPGLTIAPQAPAWPTNHLRPNWIGERVTAERTHKPEDIRNYWFTNVARLPVFDPDKEHLVALFLNTKLKCIGWNLVSVGSLNESVAHPREIFRPVIAAASYAFVLAHNHPSGETHPSDADLRLTRRLSEGAELLQIRFLDHVIIGRTTSDTLFSFKGAGIL